MGRRPWLAPMRRSASGLIAPTTPTQAANFVAASSQKFTLASNASIQSGDIDLWIAGWIDIDISAVSVLMMKGKGGDTITTCEYGAALKTTGSLVLELYLNGAVAKAHSTVLSLATRYHYLMYYDAVGDTCGVILNAGAAQTAAAVAGPLAAGAGVFSMGGDTNAGRYFDGQMQPAAYGKNPPGGIAGIAAAIATALYNGGTPLNYAGLTAAQKTDWGLVSFWNFDGDANDKHGTNHLTNVNGVTFVAYP